MAIKYYWKCSNNFAAGSKIHRIHFWKWRIACFWLWNIVSLKHPFWGRCNLLFYSLISLKLCILISKCIEVTWNKTTVKYRCPIVSIALKIRLSVRNNILEVILPMTFIKAFCTYDSMLNTSETAICKSFWCL